MTDFERKLDSLAKINRHVHLTSAEKDLHRQKLIAFMKKAPAPNSWQKLMESMQSLSHRLKPAYLATAITLMASGGLVMAAENSLPDSPLYFIKTNLIEKVQSGLATSTEQQADLHKNLAVKRLEEAQNLAEKNQLTPELSASLNQQFEEKNQAMENALKVMEERHQVEEARNLRNEYAKSIQAHQQVISILRSNIEKHQEKSSETHDNSAPIIQPVDQKKPENKDSERQRASKQQEERKIINDILIKEKPTTTYRPGNQQKAPDTEPKQSEKKQENKAPREIDNKTDSRKSHSPSRYPISTPARLNPLTTPVIKVNSPVTTVAPLPETVSPPEQINTPVLQPSSDLQPLTELPVVETRLQDNSENLRTTEYNREADNREADKRRLEEPSQYLNFYPTNQETRSTDSEYNK